MKRHSTTILAAVLLLLFGIARLMAHDTTEPPVVDLLITTDGARLSVVARMPVAVLSDVNLPRNPDGRLVSQGLEQPLQLVAREVATSLEVEQGDALLPMPATQAALSADGAFVNIELRYQLLTGAGAVSARLHTFRAGPGVVPTIARFVVSPEVTRRFELTGDPERVVFAPAPTRVIQQFLGRGTTALLNGWDFLLFALCLAVPFRRHGSLRSACVALLAGECVASLLTASGAIVASPTPLAVMQSIAASAVVVASLQGVAGGLSRWLWLLAFVFGLANGFSLGDTFQHALPYSGDHAVLAYVCFLLVAQAGQLWTIVLFSAASGLLYRWGVPERAASVALSVYACHGALHRIGDGAAALPDSSPFTADHFLAVLTLAWSAAMIVAGIIETLGGDRDADRDTPVLDGASGGYIR